MIAVGVEKKEKKIYVGACTRDFGHFDELSIVKFTLFSSFVLSQLPPTNWTIVQSQDSKRNLSQLIQLISQMRGMSRFEALLMFFFSIEELRCEDSD